MVEAFAKALPAGREASPIDSNLDSAIVTAPEARDPAMLRRLDAVCRRVLKP
jgi:5'-methylthioadenosine phosphorylase